MDQQVLSPRDIAEKFGVTPATVVRWAHEGKLPSFRTPGGGWRFHADVVDQFIPPIEATETTS